MKSGTKSQKKIEDNEVVDKKIQAPFKYLTSIPGKKLRNLLGEALNHWLDIPKDKLEIILEIVSDFHNMTLLIDDIQDGSVLRRSVPATHCIYGITNTVLSADYIILKAIQQVTLLNHPEAMKIYMDLKREVIAGQGLELYWRDNFHCPTQEEYLQMITKKTGGTFFLATNLMQLFSKTNKDVDKLLTAVGLYFQINDDYQNLNSQTFFHNKGFCEDITEGKFGFPIVHAINTHPKEGKIIMNILREKTQDVQEKKRCISIIEACGSFEYTRKVLKELKDTIFVEVEKIGKNSIFQNFLQRIIPPS